MLTSKAQRRRGSPSLYSCLVWVLAELGTSGENSYCWEEINLPHHPHGVDWAPPLLNIHGSLSYWWTALSPELCVSDSGRERNGGSEREGLCPALKSQHRTAGTYHRPDSRKGGLKNRDKKSGNSSALGAPTKRDWPLSLLKPGKLFSFFFSLQPLY